MKVLQHVKRLILIICLMTSFVQAELPESIECLVKHEQTKVILGKLYDHHMLGESDLQAMIKKHFEPLQQFVDQQNQKVLTAPESQTSTEAQKVALKLERMRKEELALQGLKLDLNLALGKVTAAQTPKWLNIDVVSEMSMKVGRAQATKEFFFGNAGKFQVAAILMAVMAFVFKDKIKATIGSSIGDILGHAFKGKGNKNDLSEMVLTTAEQTAKNPRTKKAVRKVLDDVIEDQELTEKVEGKMASMVNNALSGVSMTGAAKSVLADAEVGTLLNTRVEDAVVKALDGKRFTDALNSKMQQVEAKVAHVSDTLLGVVDARVEAKVADVTSRISFGLSGVTLAPAKVSTVPLQTVTAQLGLTQTPAATAPASIVTQSQGILNPTAVVAPISVAATSSKSWWQFWK